MGIGFKRMTLDEHRHNSMLGKDFDDEELSSTFVKSKEAHHNFSTRPRQLLVLTGYSNLVTRNVDERSWIPCAMGSGVLGLIRFCTHNVTRYCRCKQSATRTCKHIVECKAQKCNQILKELIINLLSISKVIYSLLYTRYLIFDC